MDFPQADYSGVCFLFSLFIIFQGLFFKNSLEIVPERSIQSEFTCKNSFIENYDVSQRETFINS